MGVGSVGTRCWVLLLMGRRDADPLFLQVKEAQDSVLAPYAGKSRVSNQGQRVVEGQRVMQAASDIFLGWLRTVGMDNRQRDFYVRQLWDGKVSADPANMTPATLALRPHLRLDPGPGARPLGRPHRHRRLPRGRNDVSTGPLLTSQWLTPTRTSATTGPLWAR